MLPSPIRVVGCGSPFGDDSVGWNAVVALRTAVLETSCTIELHAVATPDRLLQILDGRGSLIVIDAMVSGASPGTVVRCRWPDDRLRGDASASSHGLSVPTVLELAARVGCLPAHVVVYAVEGEQRGPETVLSPAVAAAVSAVVAAILADITAS